MNKKEFNQFREDFSSISPVIGHSVQKLEMGINDEGVFYKMECARDNIGRIVFSSMGIKKMFPKHFFQINTEGFLTGREIRTFQSVLYKKKLL